MIINGILTGYQCRYGVTTYISRIKLFQIVFNDKIVTNFSLLLMVIVKITIKKYYFLIFIFINIRSAFLQQKHLVKYCKTLFQIGIL